VKSGNAASVYVVALTGGIASGKSATAQRFAQLGVPVFDADLIARELVAPGQPALAQIAAVFGADIISAAGELERQRLRDHVFADAQERRRLEAILHPPIRAALLARAQSCTKPYCVLAIPLLIECRDDYFWVDRVLTTDVPRAEQIIRLRRRDGIDELLAERVLQSQAPRERRLALANDVIDNTGPLAALDATVGRLHRRYQVLAAEILKK
jgi:dephospho-CoA kinase